MGVVPSPALHAGAPGEADDRPAPDPSVRPPTPPASQAPAADKAPVAPVGPPGFTPGIGASHVDSPREIAPADVTLSPGSPTDPRSLSPTPPPTRPPDWGADVGGTPDRKMGRNTCRSPGRNCGCNSAGLVLFGRLAAFGILNVGSARRGDVVPSIAGAFAGNGVKPVVAASV